MSRFGRDFSPALAEVHLAQLADYIAGLCERHPDRLVGFYSADPTGGEEEAARLHRAVGELGLRGLKMLPSYNCVAINDRRIWPMHEAAEQLGVPITLHSGWSSLPAGKSLAWRTDFPFNDFVSDLEYWRSISATSERLGLNPAVTDEDIDALFGPNLAAFLRV